MPERLPRENEINVYDSLDERGALKNFLGKTHEQARSLFGENFLCYQGDLMWMGPRAFVFYVHDAIAYLLSDESDGSPDVPNCFCGLLEFRMEHHGDAIAEVYPALRDAVEGILAKFERFEVIPWIYGDLEARYRALLVRLDG